MINSLWPGTFYVRIVKFLVEYSTIFLEMLIKRKMTDCGGERLQ